MKKLTPGDFVHLHNHTQYSLLDGLTKVPALVDFVKESGMEAVAVTDHGTMSGIVELYKTAKAAGIKPIIGMEAYMAARSHSDKDPGKDRPNFHLTMLAMNYAGYQNLMRLSTIANLEGFYYKPRIDRELLERYNEGLIILSGCIGGEVGDALRQGQYAAAKKIAAWYKKVFGDRYYIELMDHGHPEHPSVWEQQRLVNEQLLKLSEELSIPAVVTNDAHYLKKADKEAHEILLCVQTAAFLSDTNRMSLADFELHVSHPDDIIRRWGAEFPELIRNTKKIAERIDVQLQLGSILIPSFPVPKGKTEKSLLHLKVWQGLARRYGGAQESEADKLGVADAKKLLPSDIIERAEYELGVVDKMGFSGYLLIVSDFINWGKDRGIVFGPGRGSAAGSIASYALRITELDPLAYDLLFERFLNPDRIAMPDIDIDIQDSRRDEVIQYCIEKYGKDKVANIVTFGRMAARNAVRDVARVLQVPYADADRMAKLIPPPLQGRHIALGASLKANNDLKREYDSSPVSARVYDLAQGVEGTIRSHGVHAAGVVIAPDEIVKYVPLEMAQKGVIATQYSMGPIEDLGLLKMDFLGLSNLTTIKNALRIIKRVYGQDIDINTIPLDDSKTFELFQHGDTTGVFQLESAGMRRYLKELKPTVFEDIIAMVALYRPGPMQWIGDFIDRKHGTKAIQYLHPAMEPALKNTYGIIVYQEQVMQISKDMCGFSGGQADTLRKAIGKKIPEVMAKLKHDFIDGAIATVGAERPLVEKLWNQLEDFAAYCFNKSHAACYGMIAYQTAYLKAHYPSAFMAALMTSDYDDTDRLSIDLNACKNLGIKVLPPDINESFHEFAIVPDGDNRITDIRFGLDAVKNVGHGAAEEIIRSRELLGGSFDSMETFAANVSGRLVNRKSLESLSKAGAFDRYRDRRNVVANIDAIQKFGERIQKQKASGQVDLFGEGAVDSLPVQNKILWLEFDTSEYDSRIQLQWERELLGLYLSQHPLDAFAGWLEEKTMPLSMLTPEMDGKNVIVGGGITTVREITTKNGAKMAFVGMADKFGETELILFPNAYQATAGLWQPDKIVLVRGKLNAKDRDGNVGTELKVMVDDAREVTHEQVAGYAITGKKLKLPGSRGKPALKSVREPGPAKIQSDPRLYIRLINGQDEQVLLSLKQLLDKHQGATEVVLVTGAEPSKQIIKLTQTLRHDQDIHQELESVFGNGNVILK